MKMMRVAACAAVLAVAGAGFAFAQGAMASWSDPLNRFSIQRPASWPVDQASNSSPEVGHFIAGAAAADCHFFAIARPQTAANPPATARAGFATPLTREQWVQVTSSIQMFHGGGDIQTMSVDNSGAWPIQRATIKVGTDTIESAIVGRPGLEIWAFCQSYDATDRTAIFNSIIESVTTPHDAEWATQLTAAPAAPAPAGHNAHH